MKFILLTIGIGFFSTISAQETKVWTLKECVDYALENNISAKQTALDINVAEQDVKAAKWNFAPNLNGNASQNFNFGSSISTVGLRVSSNLRSNNFGLNSSVTLFDGFANIHTLKQAKIGVLAQDAALAKMKNDISLNVVNGYLQILFAKEQVKVAKSQIEISEFEVTRAEVLVDAGALPYGDLVNIKSTLATDQQNLIITENTLVITSLQLAQLLQLQEMTIEVENVNVELANQEVLGNSAIEIYNKANETFPEIKLAELNILSAEESVKIAQANYMPTLTFSAGMNTIYQHRQGYTDIFSFSDQLDNNFGRSLSFALNIPLFNRYQYRSNVNKSKINFERIQYNLDNEKFRLRETIQTAYTDALASSKSFDAAVVAVEAQDQAFEYARERFTEGAINSFDFNQTKNNLISAQSKLIRAKYEFVFKLKVLEFYYGIPLVVE